MTTTVTGEGGPNDTVIAAMFTTVCTTIAEEWRREEVQTSLEGTYEKKPTIWIILHSLAIVGLWSMTVKLTSQNNNIRVMKRSASSISN